MPKALHDKLLKQAHKKGLKGKRAAAYTYGTMDKIMKGEHTGHQGDSTDNCPECKKHRGK